MAPRTIPIEERLLRRLSPEPNSGCWLWTGTCNHKGYGQIGTSAHGMATTHKVAYQYFKGAVPQSMQVLHTCDTPCCCNPEHLWLGTHQDNIDDKMRKGRHRAGRSTKSRGTANGNAKLTPDIVRHIRQRELSYTQYAERYDVSKSLVHAIVKRKVWAHLDA
jgi:hypothetical protein